MRTVMAVFGRIICALWLLAGASLCFGAAAGSEKEVFRAAAKAFEDGFYQRAETEFGSFVEQFTNSARLPEALLFQAQARLQLTNYPGVLALLTNNLPKAGQWSADYVFSIGQTYLRMGEPAKAAEEFAKVVNQYPTARCALDAVIGEAAARSRLSDWQRVVNLLLHTNGIFQAVARTNQTSELLARGFLMLGEAQFARQDYPGVQGALQALSKFQLPARLAWQHQYLECRLSIAQGRTTEAFQRMTNLLVLATNAAQRSFIAETIGLQAELLERLGRTDEAMDTYQKNLGEGVPLDRQRQALLKIAELSLAQNRLPKATQMLETFCAQYREASRDQALLTLGELRLRQHLSGPFTNAPAGTNAAPATNQLQLAMSALNSLVQEFPQSALVGKAQLDLGWCFWLQDKMPDAQVAFQTAVDRLPASADQATAFFKLGDTHFRLQDFAGAITNYQAVVDRFGEVPEVKTNLFEPALYQIVRAGLAANNLEPATNGLTRILASYPTGFHTERAVLFAGQAISRRGEPARARQLFADFAKAAPSSSLLPEVELAVARTYEEENNWSECANVYDQWLSRFTNSPSVPRAEYCRAWANFQAHRETNAFSQFTNFISRFPKHECAPLAQWWVADYYFRTGRWTDAEQNYQLLYKSTNWPQSQVSYQAGMMAGRTAIARQGWKDAIDYFTNLINDVKCPPEVRVQAMFAYGDALMSCFSTNKLADYEEAATVFTRIYESYPTNEIALLALGEKATCILQWASFTRQYEPATNEFLKVVQSPLANATARAIARYGLGVVMEKMAEQKPAAERAPSLKAALNYYLDVLYYEKDLRLGETPDLFWVKRAAYEAARLSEAMADWQQAIKIYKRLSDVVPALAPTLEKRILKAEENLMRPKK